MDQKIIDLYDAFTHGALGRREFMDRLAQMAGGARRPRRSWPSSRTTTPARP